MEKEEKGEGPEPKEDLNIRGGGAGFPSNLPQSPNPTPLCVEMDFMWSIQAFPQTQEKN